MTRYLLDTNHASEVWRRNTVVLNRIRQTPNAEYGICLPTVGELWFMVYDSSRAVENARNMRRFLRRFDFWQFDVRAAMEFGLIRSELRRKGRPIPQIDIQIAAVARRNGLILLTSDGHFANVENIRVENWLT